MGGAATLQLGTHIIASDLRRFGIADRPVLTLVATGVRGIMPAPQPLGPARPYAGYPGRDVDLGRYTVRHPHTESLDQYGPVGLAETAAIVAARLRPAAEREPVSVPVPVPVGA
jgi:hypothetical protein